MTISVEPVDIAEKSERIPVKRFEVQHSISDYTFPVDATIHEVWFDEKRIYVELTDGRALAIPLWWIPTLYEATPEEREKYEINRSRTMVVWDPNKCNINDELRIADYLLLSFPSAESKQ